MPARPNQHPPEVIARWARVRAQVGARVRELRLERGLTQEALSLESGLSRNQLIAVEWGRSSVAVERLFDLASALDVSVLRLLEPPQEHPERRKHRGGRSRGLPPGRS